MMWQDLVFLAGSSFSIVVLAPTLKDSMANVPLGTSVPSSIIGLIYAFTFFTLGMTFSASGSLVAGCMWSLIAAFRAPEDRTARDYVNRAEDYVGRAEERVSQTTDFGQTAD